jgi:hypothetical protein
VPVTVGSTPPLKPPEMTELCDCSSKSEHSAPQQATACAVYVWHVPTLPAAHGSPQAFLRRRPAARQSSLHAQHGSRYGTPRHTAARYSTPRSTPPQPTDHELWCVCQFTTYCVNLVGCASQPPTDVTNMREKLDYSLQTGRVASVLCPESCGVWDYCTPRG